MKINGRTIAEQILNNLKKRVGELKKKKITPRLAIILIGHDPASLAYVRQKELKAKSIGVKTLIKHLSPKISGSALIKTIRQFNNVSNIHGIIVQRPFPKQINEDEIAKAIDPKKDVDGFGPNSSFETPLSMAILKVLEEIGTRKEDLKLKEIVVIGKGKTGGKPIINALRKMNIQPLIIDSKTKNREQLTKNADIIISAVGKPRIITAGQIKKGVILISVGLFKGKDSKLHGDYEEDEIKKIASFYTPTPGGVGPANVAYLLKNLVYAAS